MFFFLFLFLSSRLFYSLVNDNVLYSEIELNGSVNRNAALNEPKIETKREFFFYLYWKKYIICNMYNFHKYRYKLIWDKSPIQIKIRM